MARKRKGRLVSLILFIIINIIVFNRGTIYGNVKSIIGFGDLQVSELKTVEFEYDVERGIIPKIFILNEYILSIVDTKITLFTDEGEAKWQQTNDFEDLLVDGNENFFAAVDYLKGNIYIYDYRGNINASLLETGEISSLKVTKEGYIMVLMETSNSILIYDPQLNLVSQVNINKGDVVSFDFNEENHFLYIGTLDMEENQLNSYIYKYDLMGHLIGSVQLIDEILLKIYFDGKTGILEVSVPANDTAFKDPDTITKAADFAASDVDGASNFESLTLTDSTVDLTVVDETPADVTTAELTSSIVGDEEAGATVEVK